MRLKPRARTRLKEGGVSGRLVHDEFRARPTAGVIARDCFDRRRDALSRLDDDELARLLTLAAEDCEPIMESLLNEAARRLGKDTALKEA